MRPVTPRGRRGRRGMIGILTMAVMILLAATSLAIFVTISTTIAATRSSADLVRARENLDAATADATYALNAAPALATRSGVAHDNKTGHPSTWTWTKSTNPAYGAAGGGQLVAQATSGFTHQDRTRAWRTRAVGSYNVSVSDPTYGIAAPSAWTAVLSTEDDSVVTGNVNGDWHAYGVGTITVPGGSFVRRILSYDDQASYAGANTEFTRSTLSATLDERLVNDRVRGCGTSLVRYRASASGGILRAGQLSCYYSILIDAPTTVVAAGGNVANVVSYGKIDIRDRISVQAGTQLHLYTAGGTVKFRNGPTIDAYVFAPNALCKTYDTTTVEFRGSLACRQVQMTANFTEAALPLPEDATASSVGVPTQSVSYLETPGYRDRFGN